MMIMYAYYLGMAGDIICGAYYSVCLCEIVLHKNLC